MNNFPYGVEYQKAGAVTSQKLQQTNSDESRVLGIHRIVQWFREIMPRYRGTQFAELR
jgi:hypothetical protein